MKVVITAGGRFHALELAYQLYKRKALQRLISFSYTKYNQSHIPGELVHTVTRCQVLDYLFLKLRLARWINSSRFNYTKDALFAKAAARELARLSHVDVFVGWAHYAYESIAKARAQGSLVIIESGSSHIRAQHNLLVQEYQRWGVDFAPIHPGVIKRMECEYDAADYIMTLSTASQKSFIDQGVDPKKILCVPCGAHIDFFAQPSVTKKRDTRFRVLVVGLLNLRKGIPYLLQAWQKAGLPLALTELVLVGCVQKDLASILPRLPQARNVVFAGPVSRERLKQWYADSSVFVLPSIEDGFGMVITEAMAAGLPVICSTNTGAPDMIEHGTHGFLVPPADVQALADKIAWCYTHQIEAAHMGRQAQERAYHFTWDIYGQRVYDLYTMLIKKRREGAQ